VIKQHTDTEGGEISPEQMWSIFSAEYLPDPAAPWGRFQLVSFTQHGAMDGASSVHATMKDNGVTVELEGTGNGPIAAFCEALAKHGVDVRVLDYSEHAMSAGGDAKAASYLECAVAGSVLWGVGIDPSITTSSLKAIVSAVNRAVRA